jgi:hypothetical protein
MSKKNRHKNKKSKQISTITPWWKSAGAMLSLIPFGAIVGLVTLAYNYKTSDAEELRTQLYQPLYADLNQVEKSLKAVRIHQMPLTKALNDLKRNGAVERIPSTLKDRLVKVSQEAGDIHTAALDIHEIVIREMSSRLMASRTEKVDREWLKRTSDSLREMSKSKKGKSDQFTLVGGATHDYISQAFDLGDPNNPVVSEPGGPVFTINDWLGYPASINTIEDLWKTTEYLYFHSTKSESWYYRLTREDLNRLDTTLAQFLKPVYEILAQNLAFKRLLRERTNLLSEISDIKMVLTDRVRDPKQIRDLLDQ